MQDTTLRNKYLRMTKDWSDCNNTKDLFSAVAKGYDWRTIYCFNPNHLTLRE